MSRPIAFFAPAFPRWPARSAGLAILALLTAVPLHAQAGADAWLERCRAESGRREAHCEVRELRLAATGQLQVDASPNGGVTVEGWDRDEVFVRARVRAHAPSETEARELASRVRVVAEDGAVRTEGPSIRGNRGWSVNYDVFVPRRTDLALQSTNGGVRVSDVSGRLALQTTNGGIQLERVSGDVRGTTVNGGVDALLEGDEWRGRRLDLRTTNGGIRLAMPAGYNALLDAGTVNGAIETDFPVTVQGRIGRRIDAELGRGGAPIRLSTTNGGIKLLRR